MRPRLIVLSTTSSLRFHLLLTAQSGEREQGGIEEETEVQCEKKGSWESEVVKVKARYWDECDVKEKWRISEEKSQDGGKKGGMDE